MDATKIGLGALLLVTSGVTLEATGQPGSGVPLGIAGLAAVGLLTYALLAGRGRRVPQ